MLMGISEAAEARIAGFLRPEITATTARALGGRRYEILDVAGAERLGVAVEQGEPLILVTDPGRPLGNLRLQCAGRHCVIALDNAAWEGQCEATLRMLGDETVIVFEDIGDAFVRIPMLLTRSHRQFVFWGRGSSAVELSMEMDGEGRNLVIGDDALISNGVWLRNCDMHAIHDLATARRLNRPPCDMVLERHVWLGQDALLLNCPRVGLGSIIGARSLVKAAIPPHAMAAGTPARVLREGVSWGRSDEGMTARERKSIGLPVVSKG